MHPTMEYKGRHYPVKECATCGETRVADYAGRPANGGFPGIRVFSWNCAEGHYNFVPSDEISVLLYGNHPARWVWGGVWPHVVLMHKMPPNASV
jgi:hypothetical protein